MSFEQSKSKTTVNKRFIFQNKRIIFFKLNIFPRFTWIAEGKCKTYFLLDTCNFHLFSRRKNQVVGLHVTGDLLRYLPVEPGPVARRPLIDTHPWMEGNPFRVPMQLPGCQDTDSKVWSDPCCPSETSPWHWPP